MNTQQQDLRIVTLLPGATEIVAALGLTSTLVGRSHECDYPPEVQQLPVCTEARLNSEQTSAQIDADVTNLVKNALSIYQVKTEILKKLRPTHIITQDQCDVCAVTLADVQAAVAEISSSSAEIISLQPRQLEEVWQDMGMVATKLGVEVEPVVEELQFRLQTCQNRLQEAQLEKLPTVAAIEWPEPLMACGSWIPEQIQLAGGRCLFGEAGKKSPYLSWEDLVAADPEVIVVMPCGFDLARTRQESQILSQHSQWSELQAVKNERVFLADGNAYFNRPGPRLVDSVEILAEIFHPELFNFGYQGTAWEKW